MKMERTGTILPAGNDHRTVYAGNPRGGEPNPEAARHLSAFAATGERRHGSAAVCARGELRWASRLRRGRGQECPLSAVAVDGERTFLSAFAVRTESGAFSGASP